MDWRMSLIRPDCRRGDFRKAFFWGPFGGTLDATLDRKAG